MNLIYDYKGFKFNLLHVQRVYVSAVPSFDNLKGYHIRWDWRWDESIVVKSSGHKQKVILCGKKSTVPYTDEYKYWYGEYNKGRFFEEPYYTQFKWVSEADAEKLPCWVVRIETGRKDVYELPALPYGNAKVICDDILEKVNNLGSIFNEAKKSEAG